MMTGSRTCREDASVDFHIVVRAFGDGGERAARHHHKLAAHRFDRLDLLFVGANDIVDANSRRGFEVIGPHPAADLDAGTPLRRFQSVADQFASTRPIEPAAALRGVHGFRDTKPKIPEIVAEMDRLLPIDRRIQPGIGVGQRIGDNMRRGKRNAIEVLRVFFGGKDNRLACRIRLEPAIGGWQNERRHETLLKC